MTEERLDMSVLPGTRRYPTSGCLSTFPIVMAIIVLQSLFLAQIFIWYRAVELRGGPDRYARLVDLAATLTGAQIVQDGHGAELYDLGVQRAAQERVLSPLVSLKSDTLLPYIHPPFEALLFAPFMELPYGALYLFWSTLIALATLGALLLLARVTPLTSPARWLALAAACSFSPLSQAFWLGQSSPLVLLGLCGAYAANKRGRESWAGVALALLVLKPQILLVIGLLLLLLRRWKTLAVCAGSVGGLSVAAMVVLGPLWPVRYARFLSGIGDWQGNHNEYPQIMYNWRGLATNLLGGAAPGAVTPVVAALTVASLGILIRTWWRSRPETGVASWGRAHETLWALICPLAILIAPHLYIHDLVLLILPAWIVVAQLAAGEWGARSARLWLAALWLGYLLALSSLFRVETLPALPTVPGVLLIAVMAGALLWRAGSQGGLFGVPTVAARLNDREARHG